jgi:hypothetical protein
MVTIFDALLHAMQLGWNAADAGTIIDENGNSADYGYDFTDYCCEQGITPSESYAFQAGYFSRLYRDDYYRNVPTGFI